MEKNGNALELNYIFRLATHVFRVIECFSDKWLRPGGRVQKLDIVGRQMAHMRQFQNLHCQTMGIPQQQHAKMTWVSLD